MDDVVASNAILYAPGEAPDHTVVIKYVPYVADSKRALDEYSAEVRAPELSPIAACVCCVTASPHLCLFLRPHCKSPLGVRCTAASAARSWGSSGPGGAFCLARC